MLLLLRKNYAPAIAVIEYVGLVIENVPEGNIDPVALLSVTVTVNVPSTTSSGGNNDALLVWVGSGGTLKVSTNGSDLVGSAKSNVTFKNANDVFGEVSTTVGTDVVEGFLGYKASDGGLVFSNVIDGGTF